MAPPNIPDSGQREREVVDTCPITANKTVKTQPKLRSEEIFYLNIVYKNLSICAIISYGAGALCLCENAPLFMGSRYLIQCNVALRAFRDYKGLSCSFVSYRVQLHSLPDG